MKNLYILQINRTTRVFDGAFRLLRVLKLSEVVLVELFNGRCQITCNKVVRSKHKKEHIIVLGMQETIPIADVIC